MAISRNGRERIVVVSAEGYGRLKRRAREVLHVSDLGEENIEAIAKVEMASQHTHLNSELP